MKFSELKGRAVVNLEDAKKIGTVEDLMVEPESHHIASVKVRTGMRERRVERCVTLIWRPDVSRPAKTTR